MKSIARCCPGRNRSATQPGTGTIGTIPTGAKKLGASATPDAAITGQDPDTRKFVLAEIDGTTLVQVCGHLRFDVGVDAPAGQPTAIPWEGMPLTPGNRVDILSQPINGGLAHSAVAFDVDWYDA